MGLPAPSTASAAATLVTAKEATPFDPTTRYVESHTDESETASSSSNEAGGSMLTSTQLRALLASSMSAMYRSEVPLYGDLISIVGRVNSDVIRSWPGMLDDDEIARLNVERHGAIRVGTRQELALLARIFAVFGMRPVGYYDLHRYAGLPIHATAFRPVGGRELRENPFRIFCSLLRMDLITDPETRHLAEELLGGREIASDRCIALLEKGEQGQWSRDEALEFVDQVKTIFKWHSDTPVSLAQYTQLASVHPLVADIVSFRGPHINHLTPRTLDIDAVQRHMLAAGMDAKQVIEGPPRRECGIYLRQTSFHALSENVFFGKGEVEGKHKARFGEIEARGQAVTRRGAERYDVLMAEVGRRRSEGRVFDEVLEEVFEEFPDSKDGILRGGLGFFTFSVRNVEVARTMWTAGTNGCAMLADLVKAGALDAEPITYEDFLPASAAGIFQSNLPSSQSQQKGSIQQTKVQVDEHEARRILEAAVGGTILDYFELYSEQQRESLRNVGQVVGIDVSELVERLEQEQTSCL